jgi:hypothetical protein
MGQKDGTRELVMVPMPYIVVYGVEPDMVHILRIIPRLRRLALKPRAQKSRFSVHRCVSRPPDFPPCCIASQYPVT